MSYAKDLPTYNTLEDLVKHIEKIEYTYGKTKSERQISRHLIERAYSELDGAMAVIEYFMSHAGSGEKISTLVKAADRQTHDIKARLKRLSESM